MVADHIPAATTDPCFVDTNVLVYAKDRSHPEKQARARLWIESLWQARCGRISTQVLNEYYDAVTRKVDPGADSAALRQDIRSLRAWRPVPLDLDIVSRAWDIEDVHQLSYWDALIVAASRQAGCRYLLTEDLQHGQVLAGVEVVDPFRTTPAQLS